MEKMYSIGEAAKFTGFSTQTLRRWDDQGKLKAHHRSEVSGKRYYAESQLLPLVGKNKINKRKVIGYCRVSTNGQKAHLVNQVNLLTNYLIAQGEPFEIIESIGSGINYSNPSLIKLIKMIESDQVDKVVILYKDRLIRFGFDLIKIIADIHGTEIEIINQSENIDDSIDMAEDIIQIITVYSAKIHGKKSHKNKQLLKEVINNVKEDFKINED